MNKLKANFKLKISNHKPAFAGRQVTNVLPLSFSFPPPVFLGIPACRRSFYYGSYATLPFPRKSRFSASCSLNAILCLLAYSSCYLSIPIKYCPRSACICGDECLPTLPKSEVASAPQPSIIAGLCICIYAVTS